MLFVLKKDGPPRLCVDYRKLNAVTRHDFYPIFCVDWCIDTFGKAAVLSNMEANSGCWQFEVEETGCD